MRVSAKAGIRPLPPLLGKPRPPRRLLLRIFKRLFPVAVLRRPREKRNCFFLSKKLHRRNQKIHRTQLLFRGLFRGISGARHAHFPFPPLQNIQEERRDFRRLLRRGTAPAKSRGTAEKDGLQRAGDRGDVRVRRIRILPQILQAPLRRHHGRIPCKTAALHFKAAVFLFPAVLQADSFRLFSRYSPLQRWRRRSVRS